ncbi:hypothetical protein HN615_17530 [Candidatus Woesearchaeota archaeon]|nr:hypothetical protein [Candidatus Woesearchaeota archaeon]
MRKGFCVSPFRYSEIRDNGDVCDGCIGEVDNFNRVSNYKDILCTTI